MKAIKVFLLLLLCAGWRLGAQTIDVNSLKFNCSSRSDAISAQRVIYKVHKDSINFIFNNSFTKDGISSHLYPYQVEVYYSDTLAANLTYSLSLSTSEDSLNINYAIDGSRSAGDYYIKFLFSTSGSGYTYNSQICLGRLRTASCTSNSCQAVSNPTFATSGSVYGADPFPTGNITCWQKAWGTPQMNASSTPSLNFATFWHGTTSSAFGGQQIGEGIMQVLPAPLSTSKTYALVTEAKIHPATTTTLDHFIVALTQSGSSNLPINSGTPSGDPIPSFTNQQILNTSLSSPTAWNTFGGCFTPASNYNQVVLYAQQNTTTAAWAAVKSVNIYDITSQTENVTLTCATPTAQIGNFTCLVPNATYSWSPSAGLSNSSVLNPVASPTVTTHYTLTVTIPLQNTTCHFYHYSNVSAPVNTVVVSASASPSAICSGSSTLSASGATSYTWQPGSTSGSTAVVSPSSTTTYTVTGKDAASCSNTATVQVKVISPAVTVTATTSYICNSSASFTAVPNFSGSNTYSWTVKDLATGTVVSVPITGSATATPTINFSGLYQNVSVCATVTGTAGCSATACIPLYACCPTPTNTTKYSNTTFSVSTNIAGTATQKYQFGGTITVSSGTLNISTAEVTMDPGTTIIVSSGARLNLDKCYLHACNAMWNGIWAPGSGTVSVNQSRVEDAKEALVDSTGAATLIVTNDYFNKNYYAMCGKGTKAGTTGYTVTQTLFTCSQITAPTWPNYVPTYASLSNASTLGAYSIDYMLPPYQGGQSSTGILLYNSALAGATNSMIAIGTATAGAENVFDKLQIGVNATRSWALIQNNVFQNISYATNPGPYNAGILVNGNGTGLCVGCSTPSLQVGGSASLKNTFTNNDYGVYSSLKTALTISSNTLTGQGTAIYVKENNAHNGGSGGNTVLINQNKIIASQTGISLYNNTKGTYSVTENRLDNSAAAVGTYANNFALRCAEITLSTNSSDFPYYYVYNNLANGYYNGLYTAQTYSAQITNNELHLRADNTAGHYQYGIQFANTNNDWISNNIVDLPSLNTSSYWQLGILCDNNTVPKIQCNNVTNMGAGIKVQGPCYTTAGNGIIGNYMLNNNYGLWLDANGEIGDQYFAFFGTNYSADNAWSGITYYNTYVTGNSNITSASGVSGFSNLYTRSGSPYNIPLGSYSPTSFISGIGNPLVGINATGLSGMCNSNTATPAFKMSSQEIIGLLLMQHGRDIATDSLVYADNAASLRRTNREGLLRNIVLQQIDASADSALAGFVGEVQAENISRFFAIDSLIQTADSSAWQQAAGLNASLSSANSIDGTRQAFNALYLRWLSGQGLDSAAISDLEELARRCPRYDGTAVFQARTLAYEYTHKLYRNACEDPSDDQQAGRAPVAAPDAQNEIALYPNPASIEVYVNAKGDEQLTIGIYNIVGELVIQKSITSQQAIDVRILSPGTYIYRLINGSSILKTGKLMISK